MIRRYSIASIQKIFSESNRYRVWLEIELLVVKYHSIRGLLTKKQYEELANDVVAIPEKIRELEKKTKHDVVAFINQISGSTRLKARKWIHYGLTSSDLVDTGNAVMIKEANGILYPRIENLLARMRRMAKAHRHSYQPKRQTGMQIEGATSFGYRMALFYSELREGFREIEEYKKHVECASISGSMGICSHMDPGLQDFVASELNLHSADCSTQVLSRDRYYVYFQRLNRLAQTIHRICLELRLLARSEIGEIAEGFRGGQMGSSSMPHKRNPITLENICGMCRLFNSYCNAMAGNIPLWFERDLSHSCVDRIVLLDGYSLITQIVTRFHRTLGHLVVDVERMKQNIENHAYFVLRGYMCKQISRKRKEGERRMTLGEIEQYLDNAHEDSKLNRMGFVEYFKASPETKRFLSPNLFDLPHHLSYMDEAFGRIFQEDERMSCFETIFYREDEIEKAIASIANGLNERYANLRKPARLVAIRDSSVIFLSRLLTMLDFPIELHTIHPDEESHPLGSWNIERQKVIVLEGYVKDEETIGRIRDEIGSLKPQEIWVVSLFVSVSLSESKLVDVYGLALPDLDHLAGFGIDDGRGRFGNLGAVGKLKPHLV